MHIVNIPDKSNILALTAGFQRSCEEQLAALQPAIRRGSEAQRSADQVSFKHQLFP